MPRQAAVSRSVVLITDGYIEAEADVFDYVRAQLDDANFFAFGIGSSVNRLLIEGVARAGLGEPFIVTDPAEATEAAARFRRYIESPVLTGIDVTFRDSMPMTSSRGRSRTCLPAARSSSSANGAASAAGTIEISGRTGAGRTGRRSRRAPRALPTRHSALRHLWARTRIADLSDFGPRRRPGTRGRDHLAGADLWPAHAIHVVRGGAGDRRRTAESADDVDQPLPLPEGVSDLAVGVTRGPNRTSCGCARCRGAAWWWACCVARAGARERRVKTQLCASLAVLALVAGA